MAARTTWLAEFEGNKCRWDLWSTIDAPGDQADSEVFRAFHLLGRRLAQRAREHLWIAAAFERGPLRNRLHFHVVAGVVAAAQKQASTRVLPAMLFAVAREEGVLGHPWDVRKAEPFVAERGGLRYMAGHVALIANVACCFARRPCGRSKGCKFAETRPETPHECIDLLNREYRER